MRIRCLLFLMLLSAVAFGQSDTSFTHTVTKTKGGPPPTSNEFWFAMPQNYESQGGKYIMLYVTSNKTTTVNVAITGGTTYRFPIKAYEVAAFNTPLGWEVTTSGIIEDKGIRVWSNDADLSVFVLSRNPATSDGTNILPVTAWGTEYVVGAYHSLYGGIGSTFDYPSEFMVFAAYDSTVITITPSADIRKNNAGLVTLHLKDVPFTIVLDKGQCIQYMATLAENATAYDMTGTIVTSTKPVGVIGAAQCANIPVDYAYCDFICEMIPPVTSWGKQYHSLPFANRKGGDSFLILSSKEGQGIYRNNALTMTSSKKYEKFFRSDITDASTWTSDAPFMLAQYINSTTFTDDQGNDNAGIGDPAMMMHLPTTKYSDSVLFQTPSIPSGMGGFSNYANVIVHDSAIAGTTFDGQPIALYKATTPFKIPFSKYTGFRVRSLTQGTHVVASDSGVNVNVYGYGSYDSYAWSGPTFVQSINDKDTTAPTATIHEDKCDCATVTVIDTGKGSSKLADVVLDSILNMSFLLDPNYVAGGGQDSTFYEFCVIDKSKDSYIEVSIYDLAGNKTTVTSQKIGRPIPTASPTTIRIPYPGADIANFAEYTVTNTTPATLVVSGANGLRLSKGNVGFSLVTPDLTDLAPAASRVFLVKYQSSSPTASRDTLLLGNECDLIVTPITSFDPNFETATAYGMELPCVDFGGQIVDSAAYVVNDYLFNLTIDSITIDDSEHFTLLSPALPATLDLSDTLYAVVRYDASVGTGTDTSLVHFYTKEAGELTAVVSACVIFVGSVDDNPSNYNELTKLLQQGKKFSWLAPVPNPSVPTHPVSFTFGLSHSADVTLELFDISGKRAALIMSERFEPGIHERYLETKSIARGAYIYRYTIEGKSYTGKLVVE
ncbi:MAG TPA: T9SS type A sorting domain-containing protein [Candidatus Kapabacteria bacterium]